MATCPECAQLLQPDAIRCPACGHDRFARRVAEVIDDRDAEHDRDELLAAAIASEGTSVPPAPWATPAPGIDRAPVEDEELGDVVPADVKPPRWRRRR